MPGPAPLALWVGMWDLVPIIGTFIGALPIVVLAGVSSTTKGIVVGVFFVAFQVFEQLVLQRPLENADGQARARSSPSPAASPASSSTASAARSMVLLLGVGRSSRLADEAAPEPPLVRCTARSAPTSASSDAASRRCRPAPVTP